MVIFIPFHTGLTQNFFSIKSKVSSGFTPFQTCCEGEGGRGRGGGGLRGRGTGRGVEGKRERGGGGVEGKR